MQICDAISNVNGPPEDVSEEALKTVGKALEDGDVVEGETTNVIHPFTLVGLMRFYHPKAETN